MSNRDGSPDDDAAAAPPAGDASPQGQGDTSPEEQGDTSHRGGAVTPGETPAPPDVTAPVDPAAPGPAAAPVEAPAGETPAPWLDAGGPPDTPSPQPDAPSPQPDAAGPAHRAGAGVPGARGRLSPTGQKVAVAVVAALVVAAGVGVAGALSGDGGGTATASDSPPATRPATTTTTVPETTTTTAPPETTTTAPPETTTTLPPEPTTTLPPDPAADGTLRLDEEGEAVLALQQRLVDLGYWMGEPDGHYGQLTRQAVMAFQTVEGLSRDGIAGPGTQERLAAAGRPTPRGGDGLEIDLERQVLFVVRGGQVQWAINTSTGSGETYVSASGADAIAATPAGHFAVERQIDGVREAPLGKLYRPKYFNGGIAIHGSGSIPATPASHGCARVTNSAMDMLWSSGAAEIGTPVWVY
ncbi:MAG TPA: L,D-transpeptidase family protein [Acidimicrobiales bacterium]|nr:L,D-transpeptidase family protein [Acidimicrobiales bacterium]